MRLLRRAVFIEDYTPTVVSLGVCLASKSPTA